MKAEVVEKAERRNGEKKLICDKAGTSPASTMFLGFETRKFI